MRKLLEITNYQLIIFNHQIFNQYLCGYKIDMNYHIFISWY